MFDRLNVGLNWRFAVTSVLDHPAIEPLSPPDQLELYVLWDRLMPATALYFHGPTLSGLSDRRQGHACAD
jgi:hypothetical protein